MSKVILRVLLGIDLDDDGELVTSSDDDDLFRLLTQALY